MRKQIIDAVLHLSRDTEDPKAGAIFEKTVEIDFATFCTFVLTQWDNVTMETAEENGATIYLFYNGPSVINHVASYIEPFITQIAKGSIAGHGCFGGSRIGSENHWNETGMSFVKNAFTSRV